MIKEAIIKIVNKDDLTFDEAQTVMNEIMSGQTTPTQNAAFLAALSTKSTKAETIDEWRTREWKSSRSWERAAIMRALLTFRRLPR